ncbi:hypothetical protein V6N13_048706 [Hibiscus sabdariffa]
MDQDGQVMGSEQDLGAGTIGSSDVVVEADVPGAHGMVEGVIVVSSSSKSVLEGHLGVDVRQYRVKELAVAEAGFGNEAVLNEVVGTVDFGKLLGVKIIGNEDTIVHDIARIITHSVWSLDNWSYGMIVVGDFNGVKTLEEHKVCVGDRHGMALFGDFMEGLGFVDLLASGKKFTRFSSGSKVRCLDKFLDSMVWVDKFGGLEQYNLPHEGRIILLFIC